ncbi:transposase [bacterium]|jgi:transposase|nr:transposase [bacterium]
MTAAYSIDLRKKVVEAYKAGNTSLAKVAGNFQLSITSVKRYLKLEREKGDLSPTKGNQGRPGKIDKIGYKEIQRIIKERPTITLGELSEIYYKKRKVKAGRSILSRACMRLNLRRKKLSQYAAERERDDIKKNAKNILK